MLNSLLKKCNYVSYEKKYYYQSIKKNSLLKIHNYNGNNITSNAKRVTFQLL